MISDFFYNMFQSLNFPLGDYFDLLGWKISTNNIIALIFAILFTITIINIFRFFKHLI